MSYNNPFDNGSNLPPGVTQDMIDRHLSGPDEHPVGDHEPVDETLYQGPRDTAMELLREARDAIEKLDFKHIEALRQPLRDFLELPEPLASDPVSYIYNDDDIPF